MSYVYIVLSVAYLCATIAHTTINWENARWWSSITVAKLIIFCVSGIFIAVLNEDPYEYFIDSPLENTFEYVRNNAIIWSVIALVFICPFSLLLKITPERVAVNQYNVSCVDAVYADSGNSRNCIVEFTVDDGTEQGYTVMALAKDLGYSDVEVDKDSVTPYESLEPEGVILKIPRTFLKRSIPKIPKSLIIG